MTITALFFVFVSLASASTLVHEDLLFSAKGDLNQFKKAELSPFDPNGTYVLKNGSSDFLKIRSDKAGSNEVEMKKAFQKKVFQYALLFQERTSPYKGAITANTECFDKGALDKRMINNKDFTSVVSDTRATDNFAYGKCDGEEAKYFSRYVVIVCKKAQKIYDVRLYSHDKKRAMDLDVKCAL